MPMIDVEAARGTFADPSTLAQALAEAVMTIEQVPNIPMFRKNTAAFVHTVDAVSTVDGDSNDVRVQVLTNAGALDRDKQLAVVERLTAIVADAARDPSLAQRTWVLVTEAPEGGWGLWGHAHNQRRARLGCPRRDRTPPGRLLHGVGRRAHQEADRRRS
ncbi:MAG TPA: hypothetical protein PLS37_09150, partial [Propioniciclava tarda]|nr:hypothetical protein [Propioniciclava tarda]